MKASEVISLLLSFFSLANGFRPGRDRPSLRGLERSIVRPVMHTFFNELKPIGRLSTSAGMSADAHNRMISVWTDSWQKAGWNTRILTMEDAKKHPEFDELDAMIRNLKMNEYESMCYYRWLAMSAVGGGWMSDYDTLPLNNFVDQGINLPFEGAFTVYETHVPSLLSGSANEWQRMTRRLLEFASSNMKANGEKPSDMQSLQGLRELYPSIYISQFQVAGRFSTPEMDIWTDKLCQQLTPRNMRAIHFSHFMIDNDWLPNHPNDKLDDRPDIARRWLENWLTSCGRLQLQE